MQFLAAAILGALIQGAGTLIGRILIALGIGFVTYSGISILLDSIRADVISGFSGLPVLAYQIAAACKVDVAITMIFSAITARLVLKGLTGGSIKRMVLK